MKFKTIAFVAVALLLVLTGCNSIPPNEEKPQSSSFSESNPYTPESETPAADEISEVGTTSEAVQSAEPQEQAEIPERNMVSSEQPQAIPAPRQKAHPAEQPNEADKTETPIPQATPSVPKQSESNEPEPEGTPPTVIEQPHETEQIPNETKPAFDIGYWVSFAKGYAESVGLELDSEAVYCWDNPLGAGAHSKYLERDITACLNRYAKDEEITAVWVWAESTGDNTFDLYIGYA